MKKLSYVYALLLLGVGLFYMAYQVKNQVAATRLSAFAGFFISCPVVFLAMQGTQKLLNEDKNA